MKNIVLIITFLMTSTAMAKQQRVAALPLRVKTLQKMSQHQMKAMRFAYIQFMKDADHYIKQSNSKGEEFKKTSLFERYYKELKKSYEAYAADPNDVLCFYGGWPSISPAVNGVPSNICDPPWKHTDHDLIKNNFAKTYTRDNSCGNTGQFRCNPSLFGRKRVASPGDFTHTSREPGLGERKTIVNLAAPHPEKGFCIQLRKPNGVFDSVDIAERCEAASAHQADQMVQELRDEIEKEGSNSEKFKELQKLHDSILGENGFCHPTNPSFALLEPVEGDDSHHPACDSLKDRLSLLGISPTQAEQTTDDQFALVSAPDGNIAARVMQECADKIDEAGRDRFNRGLVNFLQGGLQQCGATSTQDESAMASFQQDFGEIEDKFHQRRYLQDLNDINFKQLAQAILLNQHQFGEGVLNSPVRGIFNPDGTVNKAQFKAQLKQEMDQYGKSEARENELDEVLDDVISDFNAKKNRIPKSPPNQFLGEIQRHSGALNQYCNDIHKRFRQAYPDTSRCSWVYTFRKPDLCEGAEDFIKGEQAGLHSEIERFLVQSGAVRLMGTEAFQKNGMDLTSTDFATRCAEDPAASVLSRAFNQNHLEAALAQSHQQILADVANLNEKEEKLVESIVDDGEETARSNFDFESEIEDYIKNERTVVLQSLMRGSDREDKYRRSMYVCKQIDEEYSADFWKRWGSLIGTGVGATAACVGGCVFGMGVGCGVCGPAFMAAGAISGGLAAGVNYTDAAERKERANQNIASGQSDVRQNLLDNLNADSQTTQSYFEAGGAILSMTPFGLISRSAPAAGAVDEVAGTAVRVLDDTGTEIITQGNTELAKRTAQTGVATTNTSTNVAVQSGQKATGETLADGGQKLLGHSSTPSTTSGSVTAQQSGSVTRKQSGSVTGQTSGSVQGANGSITGAEQGVVKGRELVVYTGVRSTGQGGARAGTTQTGQVGASQYDEFLKAATDGTVNASSSPQAIRDAFMRFNIPFRDGNIMRFGNGTTAQIASDGSFAYGRYALYIDEAGFIFEKGTGRIMGQVMDDMDGMIMIAQEGAEHLSRRQIASDAGKQVSTRVIKDITDVASHTFVKETVEELAEKATVRTVRDLNGKTVAIALAPHAIREAGVENNDRTRETASDELDALTRKAGPEIFTVQNIVTKQGDTTVVSSEGRRLFQLMANIKSYPSEVVENLESIDTMTQEQARAAIQRLHPHTIDWNNKGTSQFASRSLHSSLANHEVLNQLGAASDLITAGEQTHDAYIEMLRPEAEIIEALIIKAGLSLPQ